MLTNLRYF